MFYVFCCIIGLMGAGLIWLIISKIKSKVLACVLSCLVGFMAAVGATILAAYMLPVVITTGIGATKI